LLSRLVAACRRGRLDEESRSELAAHLEQLIARNVRAGLPPAEAARAARQQFGNATLVREDLYLMHSMPALESLVHDVRHAVRGFAARPGFAVVAVVTLALGIGAPTAVFSVIDAVLLRPLPYPEPDRLVRFELRTSGPMGAIAIDALPASTALAWSEQTTTLEGLALHMDRPLTLSSDEGPFRLDGAAVTPNLFDVLGVPPALGRTLDASDPDPHQIVLGHAMWTRFFAASPSLVGTTIDMDGEPYRVVGVMPEAFAFPRPETAFWTPLGLGPGEGRGMLVPAIARRLPTVTLAAVADEGRSRLEQDGAGDLGRTMAAYTLQDQMVGAVSGLLWILLAAVVVVLVIATTNVALLLLTRGAAREREFSIRVALGAGRGRLVQQLIVESLTLGAAGVVGGVALASAGLALLLAIAPADIPRLRDATLDGRVLAFALAIATGTSVVFGLLSAGRTLAIDPAQSLGRPGGDARLGSAAAPLGRKLGALSASGLALTTVLLVVAGLLLRSLIGLLLVDQGFQPDGALALQVQLPAARYATPAERLSFDERLVDRLRALNGVETAGLAVTMPNRQPTGRFLLSAVPIAAPAGPAAGMRAIPVHMITERFMEAMGLRLLAGRTFRRDDGEGAEPVVVISEQLARQQFPGGGAVGALLYSPETRWRVVGVVGDVRPATPGANQEPAAYFPLAQHPDVLRWFAAATIVLRGADARRVAAPARAAVLSLDPEMPPFNVRGLDEEVSRLTAGPRFAASALASFALVALAMASVGIYGVVAYSAGLRTREIGVRLALGATRGQVIGLMLGEGAAIVAGGIGGGLLVARWVARAMTGLLHDVTPTDLPTLASVAALLAIVGLAAAFVPAWRATGISALEAIHDA
jgi:predicted permease